MKLTGELTPCMQCAHARIKRKKIRKDLVEGNERPGERISIDCTGCKTASIGGSRVMNVKYDFGSRKLWCSALKGKDQIANDNMAFIEYMTCMKSVPPKYVRMDGSPENKKFMERCKLKHPSIVFEFTGKDTPQQNGRIEAIIAAIWNQARALLDGVELERGKKNKMWVEAFNTAVMVDGIIVKEGQDKCADEKWSGEVPRWATGLKSFGEVGVVRKGGKLQKVDMKGYDAIFVGYSPMHAKGVYKMMNLQTYKFTYSRDIMWLNRTTAELREMREGQNGENDGDDSTSSLHVDLGSKADSMGSVIRDAQPQKMLRQMRRHTEEVDSEEMEKRIDLPIGDDKVVVEEVVSEEESSETTKEPEREVTPKKKMSRELKGLGVTNVYLKGIDRALRS